MSDDVIWPEIASGVGEPKRRLRACVENWPDAETGEYNPSCCRFPKSCSATVYPEAHVTEADLEPQAATQDRPGAYDELRAMADEVDRLESEAEIQGHSAPTVTIDELLQRYAAGRDPHPDTYLNPPVTITEAEFRAAIAEAYEQGYDGRPLHNPYLKETR